MEKLIVYVDDAAHALRVLEPLLETAQHQTSRQWILVACAPRVTHHVSKWVTHSARESWRGKWADKLFGQLAPALRRHGHEVTTCMGSSNLAVQTEGLQRQHGSARVLDARRPKCAPQVAAAATGQHFMGLVMTLMGSGLFLAFD